MKILRIWGIPIQYHDILKKMGALDQDDEQQDELGILKTKEL